MRRFFVEHIDSKDGTISIRGPEARHITRVLRMGPGDRLILMDGGGRRCRAEILSVAPAHVTLLVEKDLPQPPASPVEITLCQAVIKSRPMDYLIQKTSELGVHFIIPFYSDRTVVKIEKKREPQRIGRWLEIARNAAKQSDRAGVVKIDVPRSFNELLDECGDRDAFKIILWEGDDAEDLKGLTRTSARAKKFIGMVGPEGGFTKDEIGAAQDAGFVPVSLGKRILRAETAAIVMAALVQYEWGDLSIGAPPRMKNP